MVVQFDIPKYLIKQKITTYGKDFNTKHKKDKHQKSK